MRWTDPVSTELPAFRVDRVQRPPCLPPDRGLADDTLVDETFRRNQPNDRYRLRRQLLVISRRLMNSICFDYQTQRTIAEARPAPECGRHHRGQGWFGSRSNRCLTRREYVGMWVICGGVPEFIQERRGDTHGQTQRCLVVRGERLKQFGQVVTLRLPKLSPQRPPCIGDVNQRCTPVIRIDEPNHQTGTF